METKRGNKLLSVFLIIAMALTMLFADCSVASAETERGQVKAIKYVYPSSVTFEENTNGQWCKDESGEFFYFYSLDNAMPEIFTVEYENGDIVTYSSIGGRGDSFSQISIYRGSDGKEIKLSDPVRSSQDKEHFTVGGANYFTFEFKEATIKIPAKITKKAENTVKKIEYTPSREIQADYSRCMTVYNGITKKDQLDFWGCTEIENKDILKVTYSNGTEKTYQYSSNNGTGGYFESEDGTTISPLDVRLYSDQFLHEWAYGKECYIFVEYAGAVTTVPVKLSENDVYRIAIYYPEDSEECSLKCDAKEYGEEGRYKLIPGIIVYKKDNTNEKIIFDSSGFFDETGKEVDVTLGHQNNQANGQWYVYYHGVSCQISTSHSNASWVLKKEPTCSQKGMYENVCTCGEVMGTLEIPIDSTAHSFTNYVYNNDAKVGVDGTETAKCDNGCGKKDTRTKVGTALSDSGSSSSGGGGALPAAQKPVIVSGEGASVTLSNDGTVATITADTGYKLLDVVFNGVSQGPVKEIKGLKTGDRLVVSAVKKGTSSDSSSGTERIINGVENTKVWITKTSSGKGWIRIDYKKSKGFRVDYYEVFRSKGDKNHFGTTAYYATKNNGLTGYYKNTKGLKKGCRYYYKIRGVRVINGQKYYTQWSNVYYRTAK